MKVDNIQIDANQVAVSVQGLESPQVYEGTVEYTLTAASEGKLTFYLEVFPRKVDVPLRPAAPNRNVR